MTRDDTQNWDNYWQGRNAEKGHDALVGVGIENNSTLQRFWNDALSAHSRDIPIVDLACGAGSVLRTANALGFVDMTGVDIADNALQLLTSRIPAAKAVRSPLHDIALETASAGLVVSQYGLEYAHDRRAEAFGEIARILRPGGSCILVMHIVDGAIHRECQTSLRHADTVLDSGFIEAADGVLDTIERSDAGEKALLAERMQRLNTSAGTLANWLGSVDQGTNDFARFTMYLLNGTKRLIINHDAHVIAESRAWLRGMRAEVEAYRGRMTSMLDAALGREELDRIMARIGHGDDAALTFDPPETLSFADGAPPAAWVIKARKP